MGVLFSNLFRTDVQVVQQVRHYFAPAAFVENNSLSFAFAGESCHFHIVSNKELVADLIGRLPDDASLLDIAREIEFVAGVREGFAQLDRGEARTLEDVAKELPSWISK